ncbi:MAG: COX15/CtaA family protein [Verrucomicrobiales bacterium]|nr:COX15/CtaA family protein [Verrucomicrobiales bacterium]
MTVYQKTALAALLATVFLIFVGAIVRVTGSGLGCPDWPTCWGELIPPTSLEQVDFDRLDIAKFQKRDPEITKATLSAEFNPVHVWIEFINRLVSLPVGLFTLATFLFSFQFLRKSPSVFVASFSALVLVLANAVLGAIVVRSGLKPGVITLHMALAMTLLCVLVYAVYRGGDRRPQVNLNGTASVRILLVVLFFACIGEGVMGSQVRELTDELALKFKDVPRNVWHETLEQKPIYLIHRSFSWVIFVLGAMTFFKTRKATGDLAQFCLKTVCGIILAQMVLGILMSHVSVHPVVQVLHIGLSSILVVTLFWLLIAGRSAGIENPKKINQTN